MPVVQHPAHGGDGGAPDGPCLLALGGASVGAVCAQAAGLLHAARRGGAQHGVAHLPALNCEKPAGPQPKSLQAHILSAAKVDKTALHIGAVAFIHRFGSSLSEHIHFHVCVVDGVFEVAGDADADAQSSPAGVKG